MVKTAETVENTEFPLLWKVETGGLLQQKRWNFNNIGSQDIKTNRNYFGRIFDKTLYLSQ